MFLNFQNLLKVEECSAMSPPSTLAKWLSAKQPISQVSQTTIHIPVEKSFVNFGIFKFSKFSFCTLFRFKNMITRSWWYFTGFWLIGVYYQKCDWYFVFVFCIFILYFFVFCIFTCIWITVRLIAAHYRKCDWYEH